MKLLGISSSLRRASFNTALLHAAQELLPADVTLTIHALHDLPLFDQDVEGQGDPAPVTALKQAIDAADAVLLATPEYNDGIPGVLKKRDRLGFAQGHRAQRGGAGRQARMHRGRQPGCHRHRARAGSAAAGAASRRRHRRAAGRGAGVPGAHQDRRRQAHQRAHARAACPVSAKFSGVAAATFDGKRNKTYEYWIVVHQGNPRGLRSRADAFASFARATCGSSSGDIGLKYFWIDCPRNRRINANS